VTFAIAAAALACNPQPSPPPSISGTGAPASGGPSSGAPASGATTTVRTYFFRGTLGENGGLLPVERVVAQPEPAGAIERAALEALLAGPTAAERAASPPLYSVMPEGTRVLGYEVGADGVRTVDLSGEFEAAGSASAKGRLAQVVFTLTQFPGVTEVRFKIDGKPITVFSDAQLSLDPPVDRSDYPDQQPVVLIDTPAWGAALGNPAHLAGLADAFEAQFLVRILDAGGNELAKASVMASCGTGCRGTFDTSLPYTVAAAGPGRVQAYELSEVDGSIVNLTEYPVQLNP
jgi:spore germination protein GerM